MFSTKEIIDSYKLFLEVNYPGHFQSYCCRLKSQFESAKAEAVSFSFLRSNFDDVQVAEEISTGGADFLCKSECLSDQVNLLKINEIGVKRGVV